MRLKGVHNSVEVIVNQCKFVLAWCGVKDRNIGSLLIESVWVCKVVGYLVLE